jgi:hypothetical protein
MFDKWEVELVAGVVVSGQTQVNINKRPLDAIRWQVPQDKKPALPSLHHVIDGRSPRHDFGKEMYAR